MRRYILGDLDGPAREGVEESLIMDPASIELLGVIEDELIEEYLDEALPPGERSSFERTFLSSPLGLSRLRLARSLRDRARKRSAGARPQVWSGAWVGLAAMLVLSLIGNVWQATRLRGLKPFGVSLPGGLTPAAASPLTFTLTGGLLRAGGSLQRLVIPSSHELVRFRLELAAIDYPLYRVVLLDDEGAEVWAAAKLKAEETNGHAAIVLPVPSTMVPAGDYQAKLSGMGPGVPLEGVASYLFRVARE